MAGIFSEAYHFVVRILNADTLHRVLSAWEASIVQLMLFLAFVAGCWRFITGLLKDHFGSNGEQRGSAFECDSGSSTMQHRASSDQP